MLLIIVLICWNISFKFEYPLCHNADKEKDDNDEDDNDDAKEESKDDRIDSDDDEEVDDEIIQTCPPC